MAEDEEPQFISLQARIAALNQSHGSTNPNGPLPLGGGKRAPPTPSKPGLSSGRPQYDSRSMTINNPPTASFSSASKQSNNEPAGPKRTLEVLPPPPVDRDSPQPSPRPQIRKSVLPATLPPPLPRRESSQVAPSITPKISPALPSRKTSGSLAFRRGSNESTMSQSSAISALSIGGSSRGGSSTTSYESNSGGRRLPPPLDQTVLAALPPTRRELEQKAKWQREEPQESQRAEERRTPIISAKSSPAIPQITFQSPQYDPPTLAIMPRRQSSSPKPVLPPRLPSRKSTSNLKARVDTNRAAFAPALPNRPRPSTSHGAQSRGFETSEDQPPPIPQSSKPKVSQVQTTKAPVQPPLPSRKSSSNGMQSSNSQSYSSRANACLICRDFSGPDGIAKQYPRHKNPDNSTEYLAEVLCGPFDSPTDKARAIFTWLHHNIDYDTEAFFNKTVKNHSPENTIARGLAVCGGYAAVFSSIALKAGLECVQVTGHGKGYSFTQPKPGDAIPPENPTGHAWNAVRIDDGEWKLIDCCWGAGHLSNKLYNRKFNPSCFTMSNNDFGLRHFPADDQLFFRDDGQVLTWEQYIISPTSSEPPQTYSIVQDYGINPTSFEPRMKQISIGSSARSTTTRFQFSKVCAHWDFVKNGDGVPYCMILQINGGGANGREKDFVPFDFDGTSWSCNVPTHSLGCAGTRVNIYSVTTVGGRDARGLSKSEYVAAKGRQGMGFQSVAAWDIV